MVDSYNIVSKTSDLLDNEVMDVNVQLSIHNTVLWSSIEDMLGSYKLYQLLTW